MAPPGAGSSSLGSLTLMGGSGCDGAGRGAPTMVASSGRVASPAWRGRVRARPVSSRLVRPPPPPAHCHTRGEPASTGALAAGAVVGDPGYRWPRIRNAARTGSTEAVAPKATSATSGTSTQTTVAPAVIAAHSQIQRKV